MVVTTITLGVGGLVEGVLESREVRSFRDRSTIDIDQTVVAVLVGILVNQTAGEHGSHLIRVQGADFLELTLVRVAAVLREEKRQAISAEHFDLLAPSGARERRRVTPLIIVESEKVGSGILAPAVHIQGHLETVVGDIGLGKVSKWAPYQRDKPTAEYPTGTSRSLRARI